MDWTLRTLLESAGIDAVIHGDAPLSGIEHDSREVAPGDLFCCIPGGVSDGHDHALDAVSRGASALLVERRIEAPVAQAQVARVREVLGTVAAAFFGEPSSSLSLVGVTGTNGKTTVTYLVEAIAAAAGRVPGLIGTISNRVGAEEIPAVRTTPEATDLQRLLAKMLGSGAEVVAMEVTSHGLHQGRVEGTRFACVAFTNLSQDHLDYHGTMEEYFLAKALLFAPAFSELGVVNVGDPWGSRLLGSDLSRHITYGSDDADVRVRGAELGPSGTRVLIDTYAGTLDVHTPLVGRYNLDNLLCATAIALALELPLEAVVQGAASLRAVPGRLERVGGGDFTVLIDYAHTPDALARAIQAARDLASGRVIVVFGCGGDRDRGKRPLMGEVATSTADLSILTSDNPRSEDPGAIIAEIEVGAARGGGGYRRVPDRREAIAEAVGEADAGDVVLVAGKGHETGQAFAGRTVPFDDRSVARELLAARGAPCPS